MDAAEIAQTYLDQVGAAVMADDWPAYCDAISWPFQLITHDKTLSFAGPADSRGIYDDFRLLLSVQRVTDFVRLVETAHRIDESLITAHYVTHLMAGSHRIIEPLRSSIALRFEQDRWRAAVITNAISNARLPLLMPQQGKDPN